MVLIKDIYTAMKDKYFAIQLWQNGLLSFNAMQEIVEYNQQIIYEQF